MRIPLHISSARLGFRDLLLAAAVISVTACVSTGQSDQLRESELYTQDFPEVSVDTLAINANKDRFRVGDIADISVFQVDSLTNTYPVDREGNINFPLIGTQKVAGLTTLELQEQLIARYGETYLQNPNIRVKLESNSLGNVVVDGAVAKPGVFELDNPVRLSEAVALAGGVAEYGDPKEIYIVREIEGEKKVKIVNLKEIRRMGASDPQIYPKDIVFVKDSTSKVAFDEFLKTVPLLSTIVILGTR